MKDAENCFCHGEYFSFQTFKEGHKVLVGEKIKRITVLNHFLFFLKMQQALLFG